MAVLSVLTVLRPVLNRLLTVAGSVKCCFTSTETDIVQELCESRGGRPGLSVLTSLLVSVDVKLH